MVEQDVRYLNQSMSDMRYSWTGREMRLMDKLTLNLLDTISGKEKEMYRILRSNIEFAGVENKIITVTSCYSNEGKTTISYNLACAFAESGKKTLFIDADLRKSTFVERCRLKQIVKGLSHLLSGQNELDEVLYETNVEKLFVIFCGVFSENPTELLANEYFVKLLEEIRDLFEYVVIDTPPLGSVVDAAVIARQSDASILVVASDLVSRGEAQHVIRQLKSANKNILGVVLNKIDNQNGNYFEGKEHKKYYK